MKHLLTKDNDSNQHDLEPEALDMLAEVAKRKESTASLSVHFQQLSRRSSKLREDQKSTKEHESPQRQTLALRDVSTLQRPFSPAALRDIVNQADLLEELSIDAVMAKEMSALIDQTLEVMNTASRNLAKKIKRTSSLSDNFWTQKQKQVNTSAIRAQVYYAKCELEYRGTQEGRQPFAETAQGKELWDEVLKAKGIRDLTNQSNDFTKQSHEEYEAIRGILASVYDIKLFSGRRDTSDQSNFEKELAAAYGTTTQPGHEYDAWCPIHAGYALQNSMTAAHLFPYSGSEETMMHIFGDDAKDEMFSPKNGLLIFDPLVKMMDKGFFALVPDLPDDASHEACMNWNTQTLKEYKIHVFEREHKDMKGHLMFGEMAGLPAYELHGRKVKFLNDFRPRARYLFWVYCVNLIKNAVKTGSFDKIPIKKPYWGSLRSYMHSGKIKALGKLVGSDMLEGLTDDDYNFNFAVSQAALTMMVESMKMQEMETFGDDLDDDSDEEEL